MIDVRPGQEWFSDSTGRTYIICSVDEKRDTVIANTIIDGRVELTEEPFVLYMFGLGNLRLVKDSPPEFRVTRESCLYEAARILIKLEGETDTQKHAQLNSLYGRWMELAKMSR